MAEPRSPVPALLVVAVFSRHADAFTWARTRLEALFGPVGLSSEPFVFDDGEQYVIVVLGLGTIDSYTTTVTLEAVEP